MDSFGDKNTIYFHKKATHILIRNHISSLIDPRGSWTSNNDKLGLILLNYFNSLFTSEGVQPYILNHSRFTSLNPSDKAFLNQPFTPSEIKTAIWDLGSWKAPGPDGIQVGFYNDNWELVKDKIYQIALDFFSSHITIHQINFTNLVLIPKVKHPQVPSDFIPIGLCNSIYKIISKCLANRLSKVLPNIIDENQGVFLKQRGVAPIALAGLKIIHQVVHASNSTHHTNNLAIKLDLSEAFD